MANKTTSLVLVSMLILSGLIVFFTFEGGLVKAAGSIIYVDDDNTGGTEDGTIAFPYNTITEGIAAATDGDTVFVFNGTYNENLVISKTINLTGAGRHNTTIDAGGSGDVIYINSDWVNITGFNIQGAGSGFSDFGVELNSVMYCSVIDNNVSSNGFEGICLDNSHNNNISGNNVFSHPWGGIFLSYSYYNYIFNNTVSNNLYGIWLNDAENNTVEKNIATSNSNAGIHIIHSHFNTVIKNHAFNNPSSGFSVSSSNNNTILYNTIEFSTNDGMGIDYSNYNIIANNIISENDGRGIWTWEANKNTIINNTFYSDGFSINENSNDNIIYHNNIFYEWPNYDHCSNKWDDGYPSGGNYWSQYSGVDEKSGPGQNQSGSDGIGDTPYDLSGGSNQDHYPLMFPFGIPTKPLNLTADSGNKTINLSWDPPISDGGFTITKYRIYRGTISGEVTFVAEIGNVTNYTDTNLTNGQMYYYNISAVNDYSEGFLSNETSAILATNPSEPTGLTGFSGNNFVNISWAPPLSNGGSQISTYRIYRGTISDGESLLIEIGNFTFYNDTSVTNGITYFYKVSANNTAGEGPLSVEINETPLHHPSEPQILQPIRGDSYINLSWNPPLFDGGRPVLNYTIYRGMSSGGEVFLAELGNLTNYNDTSVVNGNTFYYQISATNIVGEGPRSIEVNATPGTVPTSPVITFIITNDSFVNISWIPPVSDGGYLVTNYLIYRGVSSGGESFLIEVGNSTFFEDTNVTNGINYFYKISAKNGIGEGPLSNEVNGTPLGVPSAPLNPQAVTGDSYVNISWNTSATDGGLPITNYRIYRGTNPGNVIFYAEIGNITHYNDTSVTNGVTYYYRISAVNAIGEGLLSNEISSIPATIPTEPVLLQGTFGDSFVNLTWNPPGTDGGLPITSYAIYRGMTSGGETFLLQMGNITYFNDSTVTNGIKYYYQVSAINAIGEGNLSNEINGTPLALPSDPQNIQISSSDSYINLIWNPPLLNGGTPITNYRIYRGTAPDGEAFLLEIGNITLYNDTTVSNGITYYYKISAVNTVGEGILSSEVSATPGKRPTEPTGLIPTSSDSNVHLQWNTPVSDGGYPVTNYMIYRGTVSGSLTFLIEVGNVLSYDDVSVSNGITYYYAVSAKNAIGEGPKSAEVNCTPLGPPSAPQNLQILWGDSFINLTWQEPASDGGTPVTNYSIYRGTSPGGEAFFMQIGNLYHFNDTTVTNGDSYYYLIRARNLVGEGPASAEVSAIPGTIPSEPLNLITESGIAYINLSWNAPLSNGGYSITNYVIYRDEMSGEMTSIAEIDNSLHYNDTNVSVGIIYYYKISAKNAIGAGLLSSEIIGSLLGPPSAPQNLQAVIGDSEIELSWDAPLSDGGLPITDYRIYRTTSPGADVLIDELGNTRYYTDTGIDIGTTYYYRVCAVNEVARGDYSNEVSATAQTVPTHPQNVQVSNGDGYVHLTWAPPSSDGSSPVLYYAIYRDDRPGAVTFYTKLGAVLEFNDTNVVNGELYYYKISAENAIGEGDMSIEAEGAPFTVPSSPRNLVKKSGDSYVYISWDAPGSDGGSAVTGYIIYKGLSPDSIGLLATVVDQFFYNDTDVDNGINYHYKVSAGNAAGEGPLSSEVSAIPFTVPSHPINLRAVSGDGFINISWDMPSDDGGSAISKYLIYRGTNSIEMDYLTSVEEVLYCNDTLVTNGVKYYYWVSAENDAGEGDLSLEVFATPVYINTTDTDQDGLPDSWEREHFGDLNQGSDEDYDGDGYSNLLEYQMGTDPTDGQDYPGVTKPVEDEDILSQFFMVLVIIILIIIAVLLVVFLRKKAHQIEEKPSEEDSENAEESANNDMESYQ